MYLIKNIKGVGVKTLKILNNLNIKTTNDLLSFYPRKYNIFDKTKELTKLKHDTNITIYTQIVSSINVLNRGKLKMSRFKVMHSNKTLNVTAFNQVYLNNIYNEFDFVYIYGKYNHYKNEIVLNKIFKEDNYEEIKPVYNIEGLYDTNVSKIINEILINNKYEERELLPKYIIDKYSLINQSKFLNNIHFPKTKEDVKNAFKKLKITEAYFFQKDMIERINVKEDKASIKVDKNLVNEFINTLPFELTNDQLSAVKDIYRDFESNKTESRLIQGDVGTGKTVVALIAMYIAIKNNLQVAFMAPTEILAKQHYDYINKHFKTKFKGVLLTSNTKDKSKIKDELRDNKINYIVGTHALTYDDVIFNELGLIIIDEQHKFGVSDRNKLIKKGKGNVIYLTATPIPRTLAIVMFQDSNISIIKEKPKRRAKVYTESIEIDQIDKVINHIKETIIKDEKVFIVAPAIDSNIAKYNVLNVYKAIKRRLPNYSNIYKIHGNINSTDRDEVINKFINDKSAILVSTSMIEVGIDISNATLITIFGANHFGLSQLHQLRGRVGRGNLTSYCYLISDNKDDERLKIIESTTDGFLLSEKDLELRGTGTFLSYKQSGINDFKYLNFTKDYMLLQTIKNDILNHP